MDGGRCPPYNYMRIYILTASLMAFLFCASSASAAALHYNDGSVISSDTSWQGKVEVEGILSVPDGVTLTIMPGTVVSFMKTAASVKEGGEGEASEVLIPGSGIRVEGKVIAEGTKDGVISFTSTEPKPAPGDWGCIFLDHSKGSVFKYCRFEYSAYTIHAHFSRLDVSRCIITKNEDGSRIGVSRVGFDHCDITDNTGKGLNFRQCAGHVTDCNITGNQDGIFLNEKDAGIKIEDNNIYSNKGMDLRLGEFHKEDVTLAGNWWGSADLAEIKKRVYDHDDDQEIGAAVIVPAGKIVVGAGVGGGLLVSVKWKFKTGGYVDCSPAIDHGVVYFGSWDKGFYALKADTGELLWKFQTGDCVDSSPAVSDGVVVFGSWDRNIYCLNTNDGSLKWKYTMPPSNFDDHRQASPAIGYKRVYMGGFDGKVYALDIDTGKKIWDFQTEGPIRSRLIYESWIIVGEGPIGYEILIGGSADGSLHAWDVKNGMQEWFFKTSGAVFSSPSVGFENIVRPPDCMDCPSGSTPSKIYFGSRDGNVYCNLFDKKIWSYTTGGPIEYSSPLVANGLVYIGSTDGKLYALDREKGTLAWSFDCGAVIYSSPVLSGNRVAIGDNAGHVYFLDSKTGAPCGTFQAGDAVQGLSAGSDGTVYTGSRDGYLYALSTSE